MDRAEFFRRQYEAKFGGKYSRSGPGSEGIYAVLKSDFVIRCIQTIEAKTLLDIGCGDFYWMKHVVGNLERYYGLDIVQELVDQNQEKYDPEARRWIFTRLDLMELTPSGEDLVVCFDVTQHLLEEELEHLVQILCASKYFAVNTAPGKPYTEKGRWHPCDISMHHKFNAQLIFRETLPAKTRYDLCLYKGVL